MLRPGDTLDWFKIEGLLGQGGMGAVYRALDTRLERHVALKVLSVGQTTDPELRRLARERLVREARAVAAIAHPSAVAVHHVGEVDGEPYIVMELLDGVTLRAALQSTAPVATRLGWLVEIAEALAAAHALGIVHRDVKPDNVMILRSGRAKVLDFGIARRSDAPAPDRAQAVLTTPGAVMGTPAYVAPEQIQGQVADARSDQFAWGVTAFEVLAGALPWGAVSDPMALLAGILVQPVPDLAARCADAPEAAVAAVTRALSRSPDARFPSMSSLLDAFRGSNERVPGDVPGRVTIRTDRNAPVGLATARTELGIPVAELGTAKTEAAATPLIATGRSAEPPKPAPPPARRGVVLAAGIGAVVLALGVVGLWPARHGSTVPGDASPEQPAASTAPASAVAGANDEYANGLDAFRHRSMAQAIEHFERALDLDRAFVEPHVRLAALHLNPTYPTGTRLLEAGRVHFAEARRGIDRLSAQDRAYLLVHEPLAAATPDLTAFLARATDLAHDHSSDAEVLFLLASAQRAAQKIDAADATDARVVALDPSFGPAYRGVCYHNVDSQAAGGPLACFEDCLRHAPSSGPCHDGRATELAALGRCADLAEEGRAWDAVDPEHWGGLLRLADALFAEGAPIEAVRDTLRRAQTKAPKHGPAGRETPRATWLGASVLAATGDFDGALREYRRYAGENVGADGRIAEAGAAADVLEESGRAADARTELEAAERESSAWTAGERARAASLEIRADHMDYAQGHLSRADYVRKRDALGKGFPSPLESQDARDLLDGGARTVHTTPGLLGEAHLRAGDATGARPLLERAAQHCPGIEGSVRALHLHALYGEALERSGDAAGAKREYERVLNFWGKATPRSVTADAVRARMAAMPKAQ